ncbi:MAG: DUF393 domain-containing protein [Pseudomonadota bacterium]
MSMTEIGSAHGAGAKDGQPQASPGLVEVFFDGSCRLCQSEIAFYQKRTSPSAVTYTDVSEAHRLGNDVAPGLDAETAMARFHVRDRDGELHSGATAFAALWRAVPGFKTAGRVAALWGIRHVLEAAYCGFLVFRPTVQRFVHRRAAAACADDTGSSDACKR